MTSVALVETVPAEVARQTIAHHSKSFALASRVLGRRLRDETAVVYTWCRRADDAVDESEPAVAGVELERLHAELAALYEGAARDPVLAAFGGVVRARSIPMHYPRELLAGMAMDTAQTRYITLEDLFLYAYRVAGVVGLMMSHVFGVRDERALVHAVHLGIAMQLTNICRDVHEDWQRGRLYIPDELLAQHGARGLADDVGQPLRVAARTALAAAIADLLALADRYYASGDAGTGSLPWRAAVAVRAARGVYSSIGREIAARDHDPLAPRAVVPTHKKLTRVVGAAARTLVEAPWRPFARPMQIPTCTLEVGDVPRL